MHQTSGPGGIPLLCKHDHRLKFQLNNETHAHNPLFYLEYYLKRCITNLYLLIVYFYNF